MDHQTQTFLDLAGMADLLQLVSDPRAAWLWSEDGGRVLWANASGAAFFGAHSISDLGSLAALEKSPARPHIARIAVSGFTDRFSIDRLRFYRGLRVMLLTCQCKRILLPDGTSAALIVCADKGITSAEDPLAAFSRLISGSDRTVYTIDNGTLSSTIGELSGEYGIPPAADAQTGLFGPLPPNNTLHEGTGLGLSDTQTILVLKNEPAQTGDDSQTGDHAATSAPMPAPLAVEGGSDSADPASTSTSTNEDTPAPGDPAAEPSDDGQADADIGATIAAEAGADPLELPLENDDDFADTTSQPADVSQEPAHLTRDADADLNALTGTKATAGGNDLSLETVTGTQTDQPDQADPDPDGIDGGDARCDDDADTIVLSDEAGDEDLADQSEETDPGEPEQEELEPDAEPEINTEANTEVDAFAFQPRRRPIRFAWKMDVDQRFTFLSDEFAQALGPDTTDVIGQTWRDVANRFGLDVRGSIARSLDRRDTWSGRTVDWPVSGSDLTIPVDLAALPAFDRNRIFEGYRGFGVCRTAEAQPAARLVPVSPAMAAFDAALAPQNGQNRDDAAGADDPDRPEDEAAKEPPKRQLAENSISDLSPLKPKPLAGRTSIGASTAALIGSIAQSVPPRFKAVHRDRSPVPDASAPAPAPDREKHIDTPDRLDPERPSSSDAPFETAPSLPDEDAQYSPAGTGKDAAAEHAPEPKDILAPSETEETFHHEADAGQAGEPATEPEVARPAPEQEPAGISGPASLNPSEIESAVKSLAKSYKPVPVSEPELFADKAALAGQADETAGNTGDLEPEMAAEPDADPFQEPLREQDQADTSQSGTDPASHTDLQPDSQQSAGQQPDASLDLDGAGTNSGDERTADAENLALEMDDELSEVREFRAETAAFENEVEEEDETETQPPQAGRSDADADQDEETGTGLADNIIPLATVPPRIVPVDTSGLSRPERQAFRKIAEALGARLEGDLDDWDRADEAAEDIEELAPEVPEAGPIDPTLLDRLPIGIAIVHDREVLYANKALLALLGYRSLKALGEAGGLEALFIDEAEDLPDANGMDGEVDEPMKVRLADGGVRSVDAHMHSVPWNGSRGLMISISERAGRQTASAAAPASGNFHAEISLELDCAHTQITEMETILETATDGVLVLDSQGTILKVNGSAEALFNASRGDMIGAPFTDFLAPESHRSAEDYLDGLSKNGVASILNDGREVLGKVPSGELIPLFMTMGRISGQEDVKYCAVLRDITQWKTAEEELTHAKRHAENASSQKSDFLAKISHEIRTPLNAIVGFSEVMMEERFGPIGNNRYKDYLKDIRTSGSHIMSLINDLLDLSKIEAGKLDLQFSSVSANDVINECVALMQPQANRERVIIRASLPESVPNVVADPRSLRQIVLNLLSNAIKYNRSGGQVILSTTLEPNGEVAVRVRDTGTGMTAKQLTAALEPFRQLHTARHSGGTGLGLPLTQALVEANRAQFHIDSVPDQGTLVEITFPTQRVLSE